MDLLLPDDMRADVDELCRLVGVEADEFVRDAVRFHLLRVGRQGQPPANLAAYRTERDQALALFGQAHRHWMATEARAAS